MLASDLIVSTKVTRSRITEPVIVFMERPGTSNVMSAMPSLSTSILKFSIGPTLYLFS